MPLQATSGAASYDAFGGGAAAVPNYIEDVFSTYVYQGAGGASLAINNGVDVSGKGGLVWIKSRSTADYGHVLHDTARSLVYRLMTNNANAQNAEAGDLASFNSNGFTTGGGAITNDASQTYVSWTFRKQPKFFDVVTYTGDGSGTGVAISHALGSVPGVVIVKCTSNALDWRVLETSTQSTLNLNATTASPAFSKVNKFGDYSSYIAPTSTTVYVNDDINTAGRTYVMYLFAHNAGGFGLTGTDNVISCGSYTTDGSGFANITLGYEPQWVLIKRTDSTGDWELLDSMRGFTDTGLNRLFANNSGAEEVFAGNYRTPTATGFYVNTFASATFIYIAIRRGPMKVPTSGTSVFSPSTYTGDDGSNREITGLSFTPDLMLNAMRLENGSGRSPSGFYWFDRLRGKGARLRSSQTLAEFLVGPAYEGVNFRSYSVDAASGESNYNPALYVSHLFKRAPSFFDEVCYTGDSAAPRTLSHNLGVAPELLITKRRSSGGTTGSNRWYVTAFNLPMSGPNYQSGILNGTDAFDVYTQIQTAPTSTTFTLGVDSFYANISSQTYVAYLFATCAGVSKVGSYTGNGSSQTINCGFTGGARFVMVKATSTTGNWIVADSARGIVAGNDPATYINIATSELTSFDWIDADNSGFVVNETSTIAANTNGVSYIFLAIA